MDGGTGLAFSRKMRCDVQDLVIGLLFVLSYVFYFFSVFPFSFTIVRVHRFCLSIKCTMDAQLKLPYTSAPY